MGSSRLFDHIKFAATPTLNQWLMKIYNMLTKQDKRWGKSYESHVLFEMKGTSIRMEVRMFCCKRRAQNKERFEKSRCIEDALHSLHNIYHISLIWG